MTYHGLLTWVATSGNGGVLLDGLVMWYCVVGVVVCLRLKVYNDSTKPLIDYFTAKGMQLSTVPYDH